jgi:hypothetical protein
MRKVFLSSDLRQYGQEALPGVRAADDGGKRRRSQLANVRTYHGLLDDQKRKPVTATDYSRLFRAVNSL